MTPTNTTNTRPALTAQVVDQLRAFNTGEILPMIVTRTVATSRGNVLIAKGVETWGMRTETGGWCLWTGHTHYAGCLSSSMPANRAKVDTSAAC